METKDKISLEDWANWSGPIPERLVPSSVRRRQEQQRKRPPFVKMPHAVAIRLGMGKASGAAWTVMACLIDLEFRSWVKGQPLGLSDTVLEKWGVNHDQKRRAVMSLERLGLISVDRVHSKSPRILLTF